MENKNDESRCDEEKKDEMKDRKLTKGNTHDREALIPYQGNV